MAQTTETKEGKSHFSDTWDKEIYSLPTMPLTVINVVHKVKAPIACLSQVGFFLFTCRPFCLDFPVFRFWGLLQRRNPIYFIPASLFCITSWSSVIAVQMSGGDLKHGRHTSPRFSSAEVTSSWWMLQYLLILQCPTFWWIYHFRWPPTRKPIKINLCANRPSRQQCLDRKENRNKLLSPFENRNSRAIS